MNSAEVIIVGAGAAGLACAHHLSQAGVKVLILEARERIGGRVFTHRSDRFSQPLEFGAEFIHGRPKSLLELLERNHSDFTDVLDARFVWRNGRLKKDSEFWDRMDHFFKRLNPDRKRDRSIREFMKAHSKRFTVETRAMFASYVEGFQAADLDVMGEIALAKTEQDNEGELSGEAALFRPSSGFSEVLNFLVQEQRLKIRLGSIVRVIDWRTGQVTLKTLEQGRHKTYKAKHVVITVPVGVLKDQNSVSCIQLHPEIPKLNRALELLHMGHIQRINFEFANRFWEELSQEKIGFMHADPKYYFPTWWTQMPLRSPVLVAWQGGPKAKDLSALPLGERVQEAMKTLSHLTGRSPTYLKKHLLSYYTHNWSEDPYSLGAYSYIGLQDHKGLQRLQRGFSDTVWLSGEATASGSDQGTVHGAMNTGIRTAQQILGLKKS